MVEVSTANDVPWCGRRRERELIATLLAGDGGSLAFCGDRGIGKTTMLETAAALARAAGFTVLWSGVAEAESTLPFAGLHRLLRVVLQSADPAHHDQARALLRTVEAGGSPDPFALGVGLLRLLGAAARNRPVLCCVDDAHWLDAPSGDALAFVARRLSGERVSIMISGAKEGLGWPWPGVPVAEVSPLERRCALDLLRHFGLADEVAAALATAGHGNPRALIDLAGSLSAEQRRGDEPPPEVLPPDSGLRRAYRDRLARLPGQARWLLILAATDAELTADDLVRAAVSAGVDIRALEPAESSGLVRVAAGMVTFPRPMVRSVIYHEATFAQRRSAHALLARMVDPAVHPLRHHLHRAAAVSGSDARLAALLEGAATRPGTQCADSARGLERAAELTEDPVVAARRRIDAARYAWRAGEPYRAKLLLRQAARAAAPLVRAQADLLLGEIELTGGATAVARHRLSAAADALTPDDRHQALAALMAAGESLCMSGDFGRYPEVERRARALRRPVEPVAAEFMFAQLAGVSATLQGHHAQAVEPLRRAVALAAALGDPVSLTRGSMAALLLGDESQTYRLATEAVTRARAAGELAAVPQARQFAALAQLWLGRPDTACVDLLDGLQLARASGQHNVASSHLATLAVFAAVLGDRQTCLLRIREAASCRLGRAGGSWSYGDWALAVLDLAAGRAVDVVSRMRAIAGRGHLVVRVAATPHLVEAAVQCGERSTAAQALALFDSWASNAADPSWLALSARCHALLARSGGEADEWFRQALGHHQSSASELDRARTQLLYGQHLRRRRRPAAAREHLRSAREAFQRLAADALADRAAAELRAAGEQVEPYRVAVSDTLTAQQLQIARLVVAGATNREVAAQLVISTRTVDHHLRNIFARLGIRSRVDLTKLLP